MSNEQVNQDVQKLVDYCEQAKGDHAQLQGLKDNPLSVLESLDINVEDEFKDAVISQLRGFADITRSQVGNVQLETLASASDNPKMAEPTRPAPPTGLRVVLEPAPNDLPAEVVNALQFMVKPWGLVLAVHKPAIQYLKGGATITDGALAAAAALLPIIPVAGPILSGIMVFFAVFLTANLGMIEIMDQGKGVYITLTWPHIFLCGVGLLVPAITPIK